MSLTWGGMIRERREQYGNRNEIIQKKRRDSKRERKSSREGEVERERISSCRGDFGLRSSLFLRYFKYNSFLKGSDSDVYETELLFLLEACQV